MSQRCICARVFGRVQGVGFRRITSYNVCYTKLLLLHPLLTRLTIAEKFWLIFWLPLLVLLLVVGITLANNP